MISEISEDVKPVEISPQFIQYAEKHSIYDLNQKLLKLLIFDRPKDPLSYLINYLKKDIGDGNINYVLNICLVPQIFIFGSKAAGKCTLALLLAERLNCVLMNAEEIYSLCPGGNNTPTKLLVDILKKRLRESDCESRGYILVGFPKYEHEAKALRWEGIFPDYAIFLEASLMTLIDRAAGERIDPETGDLYHLIYKPPPNVLIEKRLKQLPENSEQSIRDKYEEYIREEVLLKGIYSSVARSFDADQPLTDIFCSILSYVNQPRRNISLRTPRIILLGFPGSGKRTQADLLAKKYGFAIIDCGHLILQEVANRSVIGKAMKNYVQKKLPVPDLIVAEVLKNRLNESDCITRGWVLHGYPRTRQQAELLVANELAPNRVIVLDIAQVCASERLTKRLVDPVTGIRYHLEYKPKESFGMSTRSLQHPLDSECVVGSKMARFAAHRDALVEYFDECVIRVHADQDPHTVFEEIEASLALLSGLCVMTPRNPRSWIVEKLRLIYEIGFINLNWDTFIDVEMKPIHPFVDVELMNTLFGFKKIEYLTPEELLQQPTMEMMFTAYQAYNQSLMRKSLNSWKLFFVLKRAHVIHMTKLEIIAKQHHKLNKQNQIFQSLKHYTESLKNRKLMAEALIDRVNSQLTACKFFRAWRVTVNEARKTRQYFAKIERQTQEFYQKTDHDLGSDGHTPHSNDMLNPPEIHRDVIAELPDTLQSKIFEYLTVLDWGRAACVCRAWTSIVTQMNKNSRLNLSYLQSKLTDKVLFKLIRNRHAILRQINLRDSSSLSLNGFRNLVSCTNLQDINLSNCKSVTDDSVQLIVSECKLIIYLNLSHTNITDTSIRHVATHSKLLQYLSLAYCVNLTENCAIYLKRRESLRTLTYLDLSGCIKIWPTGLITIIKSHKHIQHWILNDLPWLSDNELIILGSTCPVIRTLKILLTNPEFALDFNIFCTKPTKALKISAPTTAKPDLLKHFNNDRPFTCSQLDSKLIRSKQFYNSSFGDLITDKGLKAILDEKLLECLFLSNLNQCDGTGFENIATPQGVNDQKQSSKRRSLTYVKTNRENNRQSLIHLKLVDCPQLTDILLRCLTGCRNLTTLNLTGSIKLTDNGIKLLTDGSCANSLRELYLAKCTGLTDKSINLIALKLTKLAFLSLAFCPLITDSGIISLNQCLQLWQLNLTATNLGDYSLSKLGSLPKLRDLKASKCYAITDLGLQKFAHTSGNLQNIDLSFCHNLTDNGIKTLAFCCRFLMSLNLAGCRQLTDLSVQYISGVCQYLLFLDLSGCELITANSLNYLKRGCKKLSNLVLLYHKSLTKRTVRKLTAWIKFVEFSKLDPPADYQINSL